jgi:cytoskeletal protein RodZ
MLREAGVSIGETLAAARREAGLSVTQLSQRTRIRETVIQGIERDDFSACGGDFYSRGHIRAIAKIVGVDPAPLIREYDSAHGDLDEVGAAELFEPTTPVKISDRRSPNWSLAMAAAIAVIVVYALVRVFVMSPHSHHLKTAAAAHHPAGHHPAAAGAPSHSPTPTPANSPQPQAVKIQLRTINGQESWVGEYAMDGAQIWQVTMPAGATHTWSCSKPIVLEIGNAGAVQLSVDGRQLANSAGNGAVMWVTCTPQGAKKSLSSPVYTS